MVLNVRLIYIIYINMIFFDLQSECFIITNKLSIDYL